MATTQTFTVVLPSGLTNGVGKLIAATTLGAAETIHICHATSIDEVYITVFNKTITDVNLTILVGSLEYPFSVPGDGNRYLFINGLRFSGSTVIKAYAGTISAIVVDCVVNRIA